MRPTNLDTVSLVHSWKWPRPFPVTCSSPTHTVCKKVAFLSPRMVDAAWQRPRLWDKLLKSWWVMEVRQLVCLCMAAWNTRPADVLCRWRHHSCDHPHLLAAAAAAAAVAIIHRRRPIIRHMARRVYGHSWPSATSSRKGAGIIGRENAEVWNLHWQYTLYTIVIGMG